MAQVIEFSVKLDGPAVPAYEQPPKVDAQLLSVWVMVIANGPDSPTNML